MSIIVSERMAVYQLYQNYFKPFRIDRPFLQDFSHAEWAGVRSRA
ncbi:MAG: hypothetical protein U5P10_05075 [Spirochaetia bacterium]|nr:hypothetical protein [Spirochaetia bacterium]